MKYAEESERLRNAHWPVCDALAKQLAASGMQAIPALEAAMKSRIHHVRSACLREIAVIDKDRGLQLAKDLLKDRAYEVRETAAGILGVEVPK